MIVLYYVHHACNKAKKNEGEKNRNQNIVIVVKSKPLADTWKLELKPKCLPLKGLKVTRSSMMTSQLFDWEHP
jgi:hypothetical protein